MKRVIAMVLLVIMLCTLLCGCGKFTCDLCGEEKTGKSYKTELFGQEIEFCKDCKKGLEALGEMFS